MFILNYFKKEKNLLVWLYVLFCMILNYCIGIGKVVILKLIGWFLLNINDIIFFY